MAVWEHKGEVFAHRNWKALGTYITSSQTCYFARVDVSIVVSCFYKLLQSFYKLLQSFYKLLQSFYKLL